ncbi:MAG: PGF-pre-PGF domain-containing protein [Halobacteriota archaeon]|nr:PGF-pre-PGF domain-containing protein [Halobacteriota archaeon]
MKATKLKIIALMMTTILMMSSCVTASLLNCTITVPPEEPDLEISELDINFDPFSPMVGDLVNITASIENLGLTDVDNVSVSFYLVEELIGRKYTSIPSRESKNLSILWSASSNGSQDISVILDEESIIEEADEDNNYAQRSINVIGLLSISITADPEIIEANGSDTSVITAVVTDDFGYGADGVDVTFSSTIGTINPAVVSTEGGIVSTILSSNTSAGTAIVKGSVTVNGTNFEDSINVIFDKTVITTTNETIDNVTITIGGTNISIPNVNVTIIDGIITINTTPEYSRIIAGNATSGSVIIIPIENGLLEVTLKDDATSPGGNVSGKIKGIKLNTPPEDYITTRPEVGTATTDIDVEFKGGFTPSNLSFTFTQRDDIDDIEDITPLDADEMKDTVVAYFGIEGVSNFDVENNTAILAHAELSGGYVKDNVTGVPIEITVSKAWYDSIAEGDPSNVKLFKINGTTGEVESTIPMTSETIEIKGDTVTLSVIFDHFSVFALIAQPIVETSPITDTDPSGSGGSGSTRDPVDTITIPIANSGSNIFSFNWRNLDVTQVTIDLKRTTFGASVTLNRIYRSPEMSDMPVPEGIVYRYFDIDTNVDKYSINSADIDFRVSRSWISEKNIDTTKIELKRYDGGWESLFTEKIEEDEEYIYFSSKTAGFSAFVIVGDKKEGVIESSKTTEALITPTETHEMPESEALPSPQAPVISWAMVIGTIAIVAVAVILITYYYAQKKR